MRPTLQQVGREINLLQRLFGKRLALDQRIAHGVENGLDGKLGVAVGQLAKSAGQRFNEVAAGHVGWA